MSSLKPNDARQGAGRPRRAVKETPVGVRIRQLYRDESFEEMASLWSDPDSAEPPMDEGTAGNYWRGDTEPPVDVLERIAALKRADPRWLAFGHGAPFPDSVEGIAETEADYVPPPGIEVPVLGMVTADGTGGRLVDLEAAEGTHRIPSRCVLMEVKGDSLDPVAKNGQWLWLGRPERTARNGDLVVVETDDGHLYAKRFYDAHDGGPIILISANPVAPQPPISVSWEHVTRVRVVVAVVFE